MKKPVASAFFNKLFSGICACLIVFTLFSCEKEKDDPQIETTSLTGLSLSKYFVKAKITDKGDYKINDYGFDYYVGTSEGSYYNYGSVSLGSSIKSDTFSTVLDLGQLSYYYNNYRCYARAYITNEKGTVYGKFISTDLVVLKLESIYPTKGKSGDTITLLGKYFNPNPVLNRVYFNNTSADVISGDAQSLRVIVPQNISYYYNDGITVKVSSMGIESSLSNAFKLLPNPLGFSPNYGNWSTSITINGSGMYDASVYFDDVYIYTNSYSSGSVSVSIPYSFLKKKFKIYLSTDGVKTEVPGGYFTMDELFVYQLSNTQFSRGSTINFTGKGFNPEESYTKLILGNTVINASYCYSTYANFDIPYSMALGTYVTKITNSVDTLTLPYSLTIVGK